jgi:radical SAM protein with 4Fe4S-binding SPASM domain
MSIITTYRCPMRCEMCNVWKHPTEASREVRPEELEILPRVRFANVTGGEPFVRGDLDRIVGVLFTKAPRVVVSTSGWFEERVLDLAREFPRIGIRISIEGLSQKNDELRGREGGFDRGLRTLLALREMGVKDIGFGCTVSNRNSADMLALYRLSRALGMEFATAAIHNSFYFHKEDNRITNVEGVTADFERLVEMQLRAPHPKSWSRAFFNNGLINYVEGRPRLLPCEAGTVNFFVDPYGEVYPCNGLEERYWMESMGNIRRAQSFDEIWLGEQAQRVRALVRECPKNCWMVGTAAPVMKKYIRHPLQWMAANRIRSMLHRPLCLRKRPYDVGQDPRQGRDG